MSLSQANRVTAGIPGLLPEAREKTDHAGYQRDYQQALLADVTGKRDAASKSDAGRPTHIKESQKGIELEGWRICARLRRLNPSLYFERANADQTLMGIYYLDPMVEGGRRHICGMYAGVNQEFETRILDDKGECTKTLRGWRTVLSKLIRARFITEAGAYKLFGPPSRDSENWARQVC